jgi:hypothetical protein
MFSIHRIYTFLRLLHAYVTFNDVLQILVLRHMYCTVEAWVVEIIRVCTCENWKYTNTVTILRPYFRSGMGARNRVGNNQVGTRVYNRVAHCPWNLNFVKAGIDFISRICALPFLLNVSFRKFYTKGIDSCEESLPLRSPEMIFVNF